MVQNVPTSRQHGIQRHQSRHMPTFGDPVRPQQCESLRHRCKALYKALTSLCLPLQRLQSVQLAYTQMYMSYQVGEEHEGGIFHYAAHMSSAQLKPSLAQYLRHDEWRCVTNATQWVSGTGLPLSIRDTTTADHYAAERLQTMRLSQRQADAWHLPMPTEGYTPYQVDDILLSTRYIHRDIAPLG